MKLTLKQMQEEVERIADQGVRKENVVSGPKYAIWHRGINATGGERDYADYDYPGPGLEAGFWDIPNM